VGLVKPIRVQSPGDAEEQLRPADAKVFRALEVAAQQQPRAFLSMHEIADLAFGPGERNPSQIKNLVQRSIYEIRQRFGRDAVLSRGPHYRLQPGMFLSARGAGQGLESFDATTASGDAFAARIREVLRAATGEKGDKLRCLVFFGSEAASSLADVHEDLGNLLLAFRRVRVLCPDLKPSLHLLEKLAKFVQKRDRHLRDYAAFLQILVTPCPGAAGLGWINSDGPGCFVELSGVRREAVTVATETDALHFFGHYEERWTLLEEQFGANPHPLLIDSLDIPTWNRARAMRGSIHLQCVETGNTELISLLGNL
jgi:hypothetical protein